MTQIDDYAKVRKVIECLHEEWKSQPSLDDLSQRVGLTEDQLHRLFTSWAGLTPKAFLQALTLNHARTMLQDQASVLDATFETGLSSPARLHDLFVTHEAMPPGIYKAKGEGLDISYGYHPSPFGTALVMVSPYGLCGLSFNDEGEDQAAFEDMSKRWPRANFFQDQAKTATFAVNIFRDIQDGTPLRITMIGTDFEISVWECLLKIPRGKAVTYGSIAAHIGKPKAARAVGAAVGKNPISFVVPCHRVIGSTGALTGYHWGLTRKKAILGWEQGHLKM